MALPNSVKQFRRRQIRRGISWNALLLISDRGGSFIVRLVLARLLVPEDFGLFAMVMVFLGLASILVDFGLKNALVQRPRDSKSTLRYYTAFWFVCLCSVGWALAFALLVAPSVAWFYADPQLYPIALALAACLPLQSFSIVAEIRLLRRMQLSRVAIAELWSTAFSSLLAVLLAWQGFGVWALVSMQISRTLIRTSLVWWFARWRPRLLYSFETLRDVFGLSAYMLGNQTINFFRSNVDKFTIGFFLGASSLGVYSLAYLVTETLRVQVGAVVGRVMYPAYSRLQDDIDEVKRLYLNVVKFTSLIVLPSCILLFYFSDPIVRYGFGVEWLGAVVPLRILCFASAIIALSGNPADVLRGLGLPKVSFSIQTSTTFLVAVPAIGFGSFYFGLVGAALGIVALAIVSRALFLHALRRELQLGVSEYLQSTRYAVLASLAVIGLLHVLAQNLNLRPSTFIAL